MLRLSVCFFHTDYHPQLDGRFVIVVVAGKFWWTSFHSICCFPLVTLFARAYPFTNGIFQFGCPFWIFSLLNYSLAGLLLCTSLVSVWWKKYIQLPSDNNSDHSKDGQNLHITERAHSLIWNIYARQRQLLHNYFTFIDDDGNSAASLGIHFAISISIPLIKHLSLTRWRFFYGTN